MDDLVEEALRAAALWDEVKDKLKQSAYGLSGGQQQRLCIARTIAVKPEVILMDEPCSALDPIATARIEDLMAELRDDYTIVIVTHNMQQAARVADRTAFFTAEAAEGHGRPHRPPRRVRRDDQDLQHPARTPAPRTTSPAASADRSSHAGLGDRATCTPFSHGMAGRIQVVRETPGFRLVSDSSSAELLGWGWPSCGVCVAGC